MQVRFCRFCKKTFHVRWASSKKVYCGLACYWSDPAPYKARDVTPMINGAARMRRGCANRTAENADQWFWSKVVKRDSGCWEWTGYKCSAGYGAVGRFNGRSDEKAHRVAFWLATGSWPINFVLHGCDNRACVNPEHLRPGTAAENSADAVARNRTAAGERSPAAKLSRQDVAVIRSSKEQHLVLAKRYGVHETTILRARRGETWRPNA